MRLPWQGKTLLDVEEVLTLYQKIYRKAKVMMIFDSFWGIPSSYCIRDGIADFVNVIAFLREIKRFHGMLSPHHKNKEIEIEQMLDRFIAEEYERVNKEFPFTLRNELVLKLILGHHVIGSSVAEQLFIDSFLQDLLLDEHALIHKYIQDFRHREDRYRSKIEQLENRGFKSIGLHLGFGKEYACRNINNLNTEYSILNNWVYRDEESINKILNKLLDQHICLVKGCEGRGKSLICSLVGYEFYTISKDYVSEVYFVDLREKKTDQFLNDLEGTLWSWERQDGIDTSNKYLIVLENLHNFSDCADGPNKLIAIIEKYITASRPTPFYFLLNTRPSDTIPTNLGSYSVTLSPNEKTLEKVISIDHEDPHGIILKQFKEFKNFKSIQEREENKSGFNLRLLSLYLDNCHSFSGRSLVDTRNMASFMLAYMLADLPPDHNYKESLFYLACIAQFDLPAYIAKNDRLGLYQTLDQLAQKGIVIQNRNTYPHSFQLAHPLDAWVLASGIPGSNEEYAIDGSRNIVNYINSILDISNDCSSLGVHFSLLMKNLESHEVWKKGLSPLFDIKHPNNLADRIIDRLSPGFILVLFSCEELSREDKIQFYKSHKKAICAGARRMPSLALRLNKAMWKYYDEYKFCADLFPNPTELNSFLDRCTISIDTKMRQRISSLGEDYKAILDKWIDARSLKAIENKSICRIIASPAIRFVSQRFGHGTYQRIDNHLIGRIHNEYAVGGLWRKTILPRVIKQALEVGFWIDDISWRSLGTLINMIQKFRKSHESSNGSQKLSIYLQASGLSCAHNIDKASTKEFSLFLHNIYYAEDGFYEKYISNRYFTRSIEDRISYFSFQAEELYLYSHFFENHYLRMKFRERLLNATEQEVKRIEEWINNIKRKRDESSPINPDSLLGYLIKFIERKI